MSHNEPYITNDLLLDINELNKIVVASGEKLEGNLFYLHWNDTFTISEKYRDKRKGYIDFLKDGLDFLEIGFNAGHSAALTLNNFPNIKYTAVDICLHTYTKPCAKYLIDKFDNFIDLCIGDSTEILNRIPFEYDRIHIDGDHSYEGAKADLLNCYNLLRNNGLILVDDSDFKSVEAAINDTLEGRYYIQLKGEKYTVLSKV